MTMTNFEAGRLRRPPALPCAREQLALEDLVLALREIAGRDVATDEGRLLRAVALQGLRSAERWLPLPETP